MRDKSISEAVRQAAIDSGKTQTELAIIGQCSQATISLFLRGKANIGMETADLLAKEFGLQVKKRKRRD